MAKRIDTAKVQQYMKAFNLTEEDAIKMIEDDALIDAGGKCDWEQEMTPEQKKAVRQARMADRAVKTTPTKRKKTEDTDKRELMHILEDAVGAVADGGVVATNVEREFEFNYHGRVFRVTLSAPRTKKAE